MPLDQRYADAMEAAWHQHSHDADVGTLFAESLMNLQPWDLWTGDAQPKGRTFEILAVLETVLAQNPQHPGANHLYIHAIEASPWPEKGLPAAERLQTLVPGSGHLVHMPSHIYIRTGRYPEAAEANRRAIAADETYFKLAPPPEFYNIYFLHDLHFLAYVSMMQGNYQEALAAVRKIEADIPPEFLKNFAAVADGFTPTTLHVMLRFGKWEDILAETEPQEWRLLSRAERHFARSVALSNLGRTDEARKEIEQLDAVATQFTDDWKMGNNLASDVVSIARTMALGELVYHEGHHEQAFELLRQAVLQEEQLAYDEPPGWMQPVRHALGACCWPMDAGRKPRRCTSPTSHVIRGTPGPCWGCNSRWKLSTRRKRPPHLRHRCARPGSRPMCRQSPAAIVIPLPDRLTTDRSPRKPRGTSKRSASRREVARPGRFGEVTFRAAGGQRRLRPRNCRSRPISR